MKAIFVSFCIVLLQLAIIGDAGTKSEKKLHQNDEPVQPRIRESACMREARAELHADFVRLFRTKQELRKVIAYDLGLARQQIVKSKDFQHLFRIRFWCGENPSTVIPWLIEKLEDKSFVGLDNSADLIIFERIMTNDLHFYGHGWVVDDDLFTVAGRVSWLLRSVTGENLSSVKPNSTKVELSALKKQWSAWLHAATQ